MANEEERSVTSQPWTSTDSKTLQVLASVMAQQNRERQAVALLECVRAHDPENTEALRALAALYLELGRHQDALAAADEALGDAIKPVHRAGLALVRAHALWGLERHAEAEAAMRAFLEERRKR